MLDVPPARAIGSACPRFKRSLNLVKTTGLGAILGIVSGCATAHMGFTPARQPLFTSILVQEYQQLASVKKPVRAPRQARRVFTRKARTTASGDCSEPESPHAWRGWQTISADLTGSTVGAEDLRRLVLQREAAARDHPELGPNFPELEAARAHLLGRYDCIIAYGRDRKFALVLRSCVNEAKAALAYIDKAFPAYPDAPPLLCPPAAATNGSESRELG